MWSLYTVYHFWMRIFSGRVPASRVLSGFGAVMDVWLCAAVVWDAVYPLLDGRLLSGANKYAQTIEGKYDVQL